MTSLLIDIGNSRIKWRVDDADFATRDADDAEPVDAMATTEAHRLSHRWRAVDDDIDVAFVSNVAGLAVDDAVTRALRARWPSIRLHRVVPARKRHGVVNGYVEPVRLGPDRWLALIAAHALVAERALLVCSFGTATTIDLLMPGASPADEATFVGGMILPGPDAMGRALARETARLPAHPGAGAVAFATDTEGAIGAGIAAAQAGAVERAFADARERAGDRGLQCLVTGGAVPVVVPLLRIPHRVVADLVLRGLSIVARDIDVDATALGASNAA